MKRLFMLVALAVCTQVGFAQTPKTPAAPAQKGAPAQKAAAAPTPPPPVVPVTKVTFFDHDKVAATFAKGGPLVNAPDMIVQGSHRDVGGQVEVHDKESDVLYIVDGAATFVSGGTMVGGKVSRPGQWLGTDITGGETRHLVKGDIVIVPVGIPHWFKEVSPQVSYYVVKVVKP
jgi:mannose-6-phosphate isomerase-like protein (cupin superfamily)